MRFADISTAAEAEGLVLTGWFHPKADDKAPVGTATMLLFGYGGPSLWRALRTSPEATDKSAHGLDRWSERVVTGLANQFGGEALFPFGGPPYQPFIRWTYAGEAIQQSKLGMSIHAERGLWSAGGGLSPCLNALICQRSPQLTTFARPAPLHVGTPAQSAPSVMTVTIPLSAARA